MQEGLKALLHFDVRWNSPFKVLLNTTREHEILGLWSIITTLTEVFSLLFLSCKANVRVKLAKSGHGPHLFRIIFFCVVLVIVLYYCLHAVLLLLCCTVIVLLCYYLRCPMY